MKSSAIGADHRGFAYKKEIIARLAQIQWVDVGAPNIDRSDFPHYAHQVVQKIKDGTVAQGVLLCGSGNGMAIAANRFSGIHAAVAWNLEIARLAKEHNNANVLVIPSDFVALDVALELIRVWNEATFLKGRYQKRIEQLESLC